MPLFRIVAAAAIVAAFVTATPSMAADACAYRGLLDPMYCDANKDMVADVPADPKKWKDPSTIVFTYTPVEDPAVYENIFKPFTTHLSQCLNKKVVFYQVQSNAAEIEAMRSGRLHVGGFSTGPTAFAVNLAGCTSPAFPPAPRRSPSTSRARFHSRSRAPRRSSKATT